MTSYFSFLRPVSQARLALSSLEAFAMEREDVATRLMREKEGLLEDLRGARSVQDRSAEEVLMCTADKLLAMGVDL